MVLTLHSDRGAPITCKCTVQLLVDLGVTRSLICSQMSYDNPFSEAQFKTLKYPCNFPGCTTTSSQWSPSPGRSSPSTAHRHGGTAMLTPDNVHLHRTQNIQQYLQTAWTRHPERFIRGILQPDSLLTSGLDQSTRDINNGSNCLVNRNRQCLKVVDRFRIPW